MIHSFFFQCPDNVFRLGNPLFAFAVPSGLRIVRPFDLRRREAPPCFVREIPPRSVARFPGRGAPFLFRPTDQAVGLAFGRCVTSTVCLVVSYGPLHLPCRGRAQVALRTGHAFRALPETRIRAGRRRHVCFNRRFFFNVLIPFMSLVSSSESP